MLSPIHIPDLTLLSLALVALAGQGAVAQTTRTVIVGFNGTRTYSPEVIEASVGDTVNFQFVSGNHTVTQSTFDKPCVFSGTGMKSGFRPATPENPVNFTLVVNSSDPMWFYCGQGTHCQGGMVMAINPKQEGDKNFEAFKKLAMAGGTGSNRTAGTPPAGSNGTASASGPAPTAGSAPVPGAGGNASSISSIGGSASSAMASLSSGASASVSSARAGSASSASSSSGAQSLVTGRSGLTALLGVSLLGSAIGAAVLL